MKKILNLYLCTFFLSIVVHAQVPNQFSPGEIVSSSKVNANFAYLANMIGNDNVTEMMVCNASGVANNKYYYALCYATDNQTFENQLPLELNMAIKTGSNRFVPHKHTGYTDEPFDRCISINEVFKNKWILFQSEKYFRLDGAVYYLTENHIFYKLNTQ